MLGFFLRGSLHLFILASVAAALVSLTDLLMPLVIQFTVDSVIGDRRARLPGVLSHLLEGIGGVASLRQNLALVAGAVLLLALVGTICRFVFQYGNTAAAERLVQRMRDQLYTHIVHLPFSWYSENHTGDILQRCTSDVEVVKTFLSEQLVTLLRVILMIVLSMTFMIRIHPLLALIAGIFIPIMILGSVFFYGRIGSTFGEVDAQEGRLSSIAQENLTGVRVVRAFGRERDERDRFERQNSLYTNLWFRLMRILASFWVSGNVIATVRTMTVTVMGAVFCVRGSLTAGGFIAFISYNSLISLPVRSLGRVITEMSRAGVSIDRIRAIMNAPEERDEEGAHEVDLHQDITFSHVSFSYGEDSEEILHDVSFTIHAGETVGILGETGSGKSTLAALLDRLYDLPEGGGSIRIGETDIRRIRRSCLRQGVGMVLQEPFLFSRSIAQNIGIARRDAGLSEIRHAAAVAALDSTVRSFPQGYDTFVGERGVTLSGGQKQRTAIAQMLIRRPPVMVFDDSLSAVDADTDAQIREALREQMGESTVILIAHRVTTLMQADRILVLDHGRLVEQGTPQELYAAGGIFREVYDLQSAGGREDSSAPAGGPSSGARKEEAHV